MSRNMWAPPTYILNGSQYHGKHFLTSNPQIVDQQRNLLAVLVLTFPEEKIKKQSIYYQLTQMTK